MPLNGNGLAFLEHEEGRELQQYQDKGGKWTIGVGHLLTDAEQSTGAIVINGVPTPYHAGLTSPQADALFAQDCEAREAALTALVVCPLSQNEYNALFSLYYNIGDKNFRASSALTIINGGDWTGLEPHWKLWNHDGGKVDPELVGRRDREWLLWSTPDVTWREGPHSGAASGAHPSPGEDSLRRPPTRSLDGVYG